MLSIIYPNWRWWADYFIYFYDHTAVDGFGNYKIACILDTRIDEIVDDFRVKNEN